MPVKTEKPATSNPGRVFDVAKPNSASATTRPIIVSNRPLIHDPMVVKSDDAAAVPATSPSTVKIKLQPISSEDTSEKDAVAAKVPTAPEPEAVVVESSTEVAVISKADESAPEDAKGADDAANAAKTDKPKAQAVPEQAEATKDEDSGTADDASGEGTSSAENAEPIPGEVGGEPVDAEAAAAAKKQEELDKLIESRQYALPINSVERRRSKMTAVLGLALIVVLGLLLLDVSLDAGFVHIPGVHALTHIFSA